MLAQVDEISGAVGKICRTNIIANPLEPKRKKNCLKYELNKNVFAESQNFVIIHSINQQYLFQMCFCVFTKYILPTGNKTIVMVFILDDVLPA